MFRNIWEDVSQHTHGITLNDVNMVDFYFLIFTCICFFFFQVLCFWKRETGIFQWMMWCKHRMILFALWCFQVLHDCLLFFSAHTYPFINFTITWAYIFLCLTILKLSLYTMSQWFKTRRPTTCRIVLEIG